MIAIWAFSNHQDSDGKNEIEDYANAISLASKKLPSGIFMEEMRPKIMEEHDFRSRIVSNSLAVFGIFRPTKFSRRKKFDDFAKRKSCTSKNWRIETLINIVKPLVMKDYDFECQDNWVLIETFGIFGLSGVQGNEPIRWIYINQWCCSSKCLSIDSWLYNCTL